VPRDPNLTLRFATVADTAGLAAFSADTYAAAFGAHFKPGDLAAHLVATLAPESWRKYLAHDRVLLAEDGTTLVGYLQFGPHEPGGVFFHRLYVATDRLGQGIGSRLLRAALDAPEVRAAPEVLIDVWEHNAGARRLYERFGFVATGQRMPDFVTASGEVSPGDLIMVRRQAG